MVEGIARTDSGAMPPSKRYLTTSLRDSSISWIALIGYLTDLPAAALKPLSLPGLSRQQV